MTRVTVQDLRELRYCAHGIRAWCKRYGFDFRQLVLEGLSADDLAKVSDGMADRAIDAARVREARGD